MKYVVATHNPGKLKELARILKPLGIEAVTGDQVGVDLPDVEETGTTFAENARLKAASACALTGLPSIADDSGLCIDALNGAPGIYSARYAPSGSRKATVLEQLKDVPDEERTAYFISAVSCVFPNGDEVTAEGRCYGRIIREMRGHGGFGYDAIFEVDGATFAEMAPAEKDAISHRGRALQQFSENLKRYLDTEGE